MRRRREDHRTPRPPARRRNPAAVRQRAGIAAAAAGLAGVLALAVFPTQAYFAQRQHRDDLAAQASALEARNQELRDQAARLQTDEEIERLARLQYHLVRPGEEAYAVLPDGAPPTTAPAAAPAQSRPQAGVDGGGGALHRIWSWITSRL